MPRTTFRQKGGQRYSFGSRGSRIYRRVRKAKKLVTGHGPTLLEKIAGGIGGVATVAKAVMPIVAAINTESKFYDETASVTAYDPGTNDQLICLTDGISAGTGDSDRIGNSILAKDLTLKMAINMPITISSTPPVTGQHCRISIICWKEDLNINAPSMAKIFTSATNIYSAFNKDYTDQFVVLKDKFFSLNALVASTASMTGCFTHMKYYKKLDWHMRWKDSVASTNHIFIIIRGSATGIANALGVTYYSRLNYTDN